MKKRLLSLLLAASLSLSLTACGGSPAPSGSDSGAPSGQGEVIELTYWYSWTDKIQENNVNLVNQFNETVGREKGIHVTAEYQGSYVDLHQKLQAAYVAKEVPDVTVMEIASIRTFAENGVLEPLTPYIERDKVNMDDFYQGLLTNCNVDGTWYGLPYLRSTPILYMNTTLLEQAGLDPAGPKDWEELAAYCRAIKEKTGAYGLSMYSYIWMLEAFYLGNGTSVLTADEQQTNLASDKGVEVVDFIKGLQQEGVIRCVAGTDSAKIDADAMNQNCAMWFSSTANLTNNLAIAAENGYSLNTCFIPGNGQYGVPTGGCNLIMTSLGDQARKDASWEFIKWMTATEQSAYASEYTGYVPNSKSATATARIQEVFKNTPQAKVALDQLELYGYGRPMNPGYAQSSNEIVAALDAIWVNGADTASTLQAAAEKVDRLLTE